MIAFFLELAVVAAGRGHNPSKVGGILIIAGIVVAAIAVGFGAHLLVHRYGRTRRRAMQGQSHEPGAVGRVWEFRRRR